MRDYNPVKPLFTDRRRPMAVYEDKVDWLILWGGITIVALVMLSIAFLAGWIGP